MSVAVSASVLRQAAEWLVRLDNQTDAATRQAYHAWLAADPQHAAAIARLQGHLTPLAELPRQPARAALRRAHQGRPRGQAIKALALVGLLVGSGLLGYQHWQRGYLLADLSTARGVWTEQRLADGSDLSLNGDSAVDWHFDARERRIHLLRGELRVQVAKDAQRPFYVDTPQGSIRALGTRFIVERRDDATWVTMLESSTRIETPVGTQVLNAGEQVRVDANGIGAVQRVDVAAQEGAWTQHQLLVTDQPLSDVLERLARHRPGLLSFDREALAGMQVTVMLPTDDSDRALRLLERTLPLRVTHFTPWLTRVTPLDEEERK